jgi:hypothetical protein
LPLATFTRADGHPLPALIASERRLQPVAISGPPDPSFWYHARHNFNKHHDHH